MFEESQYCTIFFKSAISEDCDILKGDQYFEVGHYHFILYFMKQGCLFETDSIRGEQNKAAWRKTAQTFLVKYVICFLRISFFFFLLYEVDFFAIIASQQFEFTKYKPSQIGAACIAAARFVTHFKSML